MNGFNSPRHNGQVVSEGSSSPAERAPDRSNRKIPGAGVLGLVALFGVIDTVDAHGHPGQGPGRSETTRAAEHGGPPANGSTASPSTFAIHWEPMDREGNLMRDFYLSDGWVQIPMDRSAI